MRIRSFVLVLLGLVIVCLQPVAAEPSGTTVKRVDYANRTVTLELYRRDSGTKMITVYQIDMGCQFTLDGISIKFKQVRRGQHVLNVTLGGGNLIDVLDLQTRG